MEILTEEQVKRWSNITPGNAQRIIDLIRENERLKRELRKYSKSDK